MGGAAPVLSTARLAALAATAASLAVYFAVHESLPNVTKWWDVAILALLVMPAVFAIVWLLLPMWPSPLAPAIGLACIPLAFVFELADLDSLASFAKLGAATFLLVRVLRRPKPVALRLGRGRKKSEIAGSRSFLVDIHLLKDR